MTTARVGAADGALVVVIVVGWVALSIAFEALFDRWARRRGMREHPSRGDRR